jgi:elongation of very long chain fatty acids protein 7
MKIWKISQFIGPRLMANKKPFNAKKLQLYYNIFHLVINIMLFYAGATVSWLDDYSFRCQAVDFSPIGAPLKVVLSLAFNSIQAFMFAFQIAKLSWFYYISKFTDFFETFIFILLKRFDMVNLYHVVHHSIMPVNDSTSCLKRLKSFFFFVSRSLFGGE